MISTPTKLDRVEHRSGKLEGTGFNADLHAPIIMTFARRRIDDRSESMEIF